MEQITLGDLYSWATFVIGLVGSIVTIIAGVKKAVGKLLESLAMDNAKNYIVPFLARVERGEPVDNIEVERFHEEYKYYRDHDGNSYIKSRVEKLQKDGKL
jgi:hypothetical protein